MLLVLVLVVAVLCVVGLVYLVTRSSGAAVLPAGYKSEDSPEPADAERRLGPVLYQSPPFDVALIYGAPAYDTREQTTAIEPNVLSISVSVQSGVTESARRVTVERIHGANALEPTYLVGFCHLRQDIRHFRVDRIKELTVSGAARPELNPSWYFRRVVARARGERPLIRGNESVVLASGLGKPVVIHWRRERLVDEAEKPVYAEWDGDRVSMPPGRWESRVEVYDVEIDTIMQCGETMRIVGSAKRRPAAGVRRWSGEKTFYLHDCEAFETLDGARVSDPRDFLYEAASLAVEDRPLVLASTPKPNEKKITSSISPDLPRDDGGTVRVQHRDRKLKKRTDTAFYLGREEFEDVVASPRGRYIAGVSDGNVESDDVVPGVAFVDTEEGVAPFVLRFRNQPRWPRLNDAGLLLVREKVPAATAVLHAFDAHGQRRWAVTLRTGHDLAEFSLDGQVVAIISGLFWRKSDTDVWTWLLRAETGAVVATLGGTEALQPAGDGRVEIVTPTGAVTFFCPPGMLDRVLAPDYAAEWGTRP